MLIYILPTAMIVQALIAGGILAFERKWGSALYWFSAALVNFSVVFVIPKTG